MKFKGPIEVSGIVRVVVDQAYVWTRCDGVWVLAKSDDIKSVHTMVNYIRSKLRKKNRRAWVHGNTLNITRRE